MQVIWMCVLAVLGIGVAVVQPTESAPNTKGNKRLDAVVVSITPEFTKVKPGTTFQVAVVLQVAPKWHLYWPGQNDSGVPLGVSLRLPDEVTAGEAVYPTPVREVDPGDLLNYVLEGKVIVTVPVTIPASMHPGQSVDIQATVEYMVCREVCTMGKGTPKTTVQVVGEESSGPAGSAALVKEAVEKQPKASGWESAFSAEWQGDALVLTAKSPEVTALTFYPREGKCKLLEPLKTGSAKGNALSLRFEPMAATGAPVGGVVELTSGNTKTAYTFNTSRKGSAPDPADPLLPLPKGPIPHRGTEQPSPVVPK